VAGLYWFHENGKNVQDPTIFLGGPGDFLLKQTVDSQAIYANVGYHVNDDLRVAVGLRYTSDEKEAGTNINSGLIIESNSRDWSEVSGDLSANYQLSDRMNVYGTIQSGYQSGQFPPRPFCLFGFLDFTQPGNVSRPNCFVAKRQRDGAQLRGRPQGHAVGQPADEHRGVLHRLLQPAVPGQRRDPRRRIQHGEHHR
jgi:iron complex outermembrane receptor protein